jgi:hypothetical protein
MDFAIQPGSIQHTQKTTDMKRRTRGLLAGLLLLLTLPACQDPVANALKDDAATVALSPSTCYTPRFRNTAQSSSCQEKWSSCLLSNGTSSPRNGISWRVGSGCNTTDTYTFPNGPVSYAVYRRNGSAGTCAKFDLIGHFSCSIAIMSRFSYLLTDNTEHIIVMKEGSVYLGSIYRATGGAIFTGACNSTLYLFDDAWTLLTGVAAGTCVK